MLRVFLSLVGQFGLAVVELNGVGGGCDYDFRNVSHAVFTDVKIVVAGLFDYCVAEFVKVNDCEVGFVGSIPIDPTVCALQDLEGEAFGDHRGGGSNVQFVVFEDFESRGGFGGYPTVNAQIFADYVVGVGIGLEAGFLRAAAVAAALRTGIGRGA